MTDNNVSNGVSEYMGFFLTQAISRYFENLKFIQCTADAISNINKGHGPIKQSTVGLLVGMEKE